MMDITDEFASAMQQLSAEAEKTLPADAGSERIEAQLAEVLKEFKALNARVGRLEESLREATTPLPQMASRFQTLDEQLSALRESETVNHRLFDTLHDELIRYRDNFLHESLQKPFIRDLVTLFDDLSMISSGGKGGEGGAKLPAQAQKNLENALHSLLEILHRLEVSEIEPKEKVDRALHKVVSFEPGHFAEDDGRIVMRVKRGFMWRDKVLRPEEVVAQRFE